MAAGGSSRTGTCLPLELVSQASFVGSCSSLEPKWKVIFSEKASLLKVTLSGRWAFLYSSAHTHLSHQTVSPSFPSLQGPARGRLQGGCSGTVDK